MNASGDQFNQYTKDLIMIGQGKPSLIQFVHNLVNTKDLYDGWSMDHTNGSCFQKGWTHSDKITQVS